MKVPSSFRAFWEKDMDGILCYWDNDVSGGLERLDMETAVAVFLEV